MSDSYSKTDADASTVLLPQHDIENLSSSPDSDSNDRSDSFSNDDTFVEEFEQDRNSLQDDIQKLRMELQRLEQTTISLQNFPDVVSEWMESLPVPHSHRSTKSNPARINWQQLWSGTETHSNKKELEHDMFSIMMVSQEISTKIVGCLIVAIQITLCAMLFLEQLHPSWMEPIGGIPIRTSARIRVVQVIAIALSVLTQFDLIFGVRNILVYDRHRYQGVWKHQILFPNLLKMLQGAIVLITSFFIILQSQTTLELFKDYSALFIVSSISNVIFVIADHGCLGSNLSKSAMKVKQVRLKDYPDTVQRNLILCIITTMASLFIGWLYIALGQINGNYIHQAFPRCPINLSNLHLIGDGVCQSGRGLGTNVLDCGWDGGDCLETNAWLPDCSIDDLTLLGDGVCDGDSYNTVECNFDMGDCRDSNDQVQTEYPDCHVENIGWIGDGFCHGGDYASPDCGNDGDDCSSCIVEDISLVGNGICNDGAYNTKGCSEDGGDCTDYNQNILDQYKLCNVEHIGWIGDGVCNGGEYASSQCGNDGGDCNDCSAEKMLWVGDGSCEGGEYNTEACSYDGGDCIETNMKKQEEYKFCDVENIGWIGDGVCNGGEYASPQCGNDGGDCNECIVDNIFLVGNGVCDGGKYNTKGCSDDGGDCARENKQKSEKYRFCSAENIGWVEDGVCNGGKYSSFNCGNDGGDCSKCIVSNLLLVGNGICDEGEYNTKECGFDGYDCLEKNSRLQEKYDECDVKNIGWLEDGFCDEGEYNVRNCSFDGFDCAPLTKLVGETFDAGSKWQSGVLGPDGCLYGIPYGENQILKFDPIMNSSSLVGGLINATFPGSDPWDIKINWWGSVVGRDDILYGVPFDGNSILSFNVTSEETNFLLEGHPLLEGNSKFNGGVLGNNGHIYFMPFDKFKVVKFDPNDLQNPLVEIGNDLLSSGMFRGGVLGGDENIYAMPYFGTKVLKIDTINESTSFIGDLYEDLNMRWENGVLAKDGNIYACPSEASRILQIDVENQDTNLVGPDLGTMMRKWTGFVEGADGFLYGIPFNSNELLRFDPIFHTATMIPIDKNLKNESRKWWGGVRAKNDHIYGLPFWSEGVLSIAPLSFKSALTRSPNKARIHKMKKFT